ncbi:AAA family ATPase [Xanthomonas graminis]|uniref:AAA family ATPase n=1 Tax=Xanthomonas graminis TaxID=3390026 RepID=UPI001F1851CB|nr:AAA family ATPase [Xanthomonas translucens]UKE73890.1 AAA family ATPase [Xanthomonas translucens pv. phleipratensis]
MGADLIVPTFNIDNLFLILRKSLPMVEAQAEARVKCHISRNAGHGFEAWVSSGLEFVTGETCPFCEENISGSTLISAYRAHFNEEYQTLKSQAADLVRGVETRIHANQIERIERDFQVAQAQQDQWREHLGVQTAALDSNGLRAKFQSLRDLLVPLATAKSHAPLESFGSPDDEASARAIWDEVAATIDATNAQIKANREAIAAYKVGLENSSPDQIRALISRLVAAKYRHSVPGLAQLATLDAAIAEKARLTAAKEAARAMLDDLMTRTFDRYGASINELLHEFGAQIRVRDLAISYRGAQNRPRTEYALEVRGTPILLAGGQGPNFGNSLSEGDKRALAFAFFMARVLNDAGLANRIIVIDDPMCSLDRLRKATTLRTLKRLAVACRQLVVLAHDIWFLRDLDDAIEKLPRAVRPPRAYAKISRGENNLSSFADLDIGLECQSSYQRNLADVGNFAEGIGGGVDKELVAKSLRPLVEGYIQRRFPLDIPRNKNFGEILNLIRVSRPGEPLNAASVLLEELQALNDYTIPFMHVEGEPTPDLSAIDEGELAVFSARAMRVVYG